MTELPEVAGPRGRRGPVSGLPPRYRRLIEISTDLFSRYGYGATTIRQIADEMGIKSASLYSHVGSKADILRVIILDVAREFTEGATQCVDTIADPEQRLRELCRSHMRVMERRAAAVVVYFHHWRKLNPEYQAEIIDLRGEYEAMFRYAVAESVRQGIYRPVDEAHAVRVLLGALNWTYEWRSPSRGMDADATADSILDLITSGLKG
ncbi:TetR/AcrR family transcriptional regulator [Nocardia iowensis]|uniref:TetR/AcrR family transcriptional regulator n=1 Tax=Nocardia iowensis TaxID=204891 RepID=A0ABX8RJB6_NOCIO|nr:TetR/AcrR family transcriptional regulator [Nocardia iowensis]QXN88385.1 TetR/AcrR family transcriptional regulator [Nocardia iowensis]